MSRWPGRILALGLVLVFIQLPTEALAYVRSTVSGSNACLYWGKREVTWYLHEKGATWILDDSDIDAAIASFEAWNEPECSDFTFVFGGLTSRTDTGYVDGGQDNQNLVVFRDSLCADVVPPGDGCWDCFSTGGLCCASAHGCWEHPSGAIAITTTTFHRSTGLLVDADIEMNEARYYFTARDGPPCEDGSSVKTCTLDGDCRPHEECLRGKCRTQGCVHTDIANTLTHEVGHIVGLDHTHIADATMYASASVGETKKRELHEDDIQGLCDIYAAGRATLTCLGDVVMIVPLESLDATPTCAGCAAGGPGGRAALLLVGLAMWSLFAGSRRRRLGCSALPAMMAVAHLFGGSPGDFESWLAKGESVVVGRAQGEAAPCGAEGRPAFASLMVEEVMSGPQAAGQMEVLLVPGSGDLPVDGKELLAILKPAGAEYGAGCARAPSHVLHRALVAIDLSPEGRAGWRRYVDAVRALPPGGAALERALPRLWVETYLAERSHLRRHALLSLEAAMSMPNGLPREVVQRLCAVARDRDVEIESRATTIRMLSRVVAPKDLGRHLFVGGDDSAADARAALLSALRDPEPRVRESAVIALGPLAAAGDRSVLGSLEVLGEEEGDSRVIEALASVVPSHQPQRAGTMVDPLAERHLGTRMLLVLMGLFAFLGMALLPMLKGQVR